MTTTRKSVNGIHVGALRIGTTCLAALTVLFSVLVKGGPAEASPLTGGIGVISHIDHVENGSALFHEVGGFKRSSKFRSHRGRGFRSHRFSKFHGYRGRPFKTFHRFRGHRHGFYGFCRHRFSRFH